MATAAAAIGNYEKLSILTRELREAASRGEWSRLAEIQQERISVADAMVSSDAGLVLSQSDSRRKDGLITQILADEAETREKMKAWMASLEAELQEGRQELRLLREYRKHAV
jgi:hypothetical protein